MLGRKLCQRKALTHTSSEKAMQQKALPRFFVQDAWRVHCQGQGQRRGRGQGSRKIAAQRLQGVWSMQGACKEAARKLQ